MPESGVYVHHNANGTSGIVQCFGLVKKIFFSDSLLSFFWDEIERAKFGELEMAFISSALDKIFQP